MSYPFSCAVQRVAFLSSSALRSANTSVDPTEARNKFIETVATVAIGEDRLTVALDSLCRSPIFRLP
jgi:hypothetical protein